MLYTPQRNSLFDLVAKSSLSHNLFEEQINADTYILKVISTEWAYKIIRAPTAITRPCGVSFLPGWKNPFEPTVIKETTWDKVLAHFERWLNIVEGELSAPDLWAEAAKTAQLFAPTAEPSDDKFTRTERAEVQGQLRLLQLSFTASALPEAAKQKLIELTQAASVAAETHTKRDWLGMLVGSFTGAVFSLALNPFHTQEVIQTSKSSLWQLVLALRYVFTPTPRPALRPIPAGAVASAQGACFLLKPRAGRSAPQPKGPPKSRSSTLGTAFCCIPGSVILYFGPEKDLFI